MLLWLLIMGRHLLYSLGFKRQQKVGVPVVVVGNMIAGGAGKTPTVLALLKLLERRGWRVGVISRGHGRKGANVRAVDSLSPPQAVGDEPLLIHRRSGVPVVVARNRVQAAQHLLKLHPEVNLIVSDDGMQHRALHRDIQILVFDERGVGNGWLLPAGPLREPLPAHCPARTLVVYNAATPSTPLPGHVATRGLIGLVEWLPWRAGETASAEALAALKQRSATNIVWAAAGIAQPSRFFALLAQAGILVSPLPLPDHYDFAEGAPWPPGALVVVTEKDAVKLNDTLIGHSEVWVAPLDFHLGAAFETAFSGLLSALPNQPLPPSHGSSTA